MWMIEALKPDHDVTVMTTGGWDLAQLNSFYGTQVEGDQVRVRIAPIPRVARRFNAAALRGACCQRFARQIAGEYDLRISAYNPLDWGLPAIHLIADFSWAFEIRKALEAPSPGYIYCDSILRRIYLGIARRYEEPSGRDPVRDDVVVANSKWSADLIRRHFAVDCPAVVYPPVWGEFPTVPWEQKENAFVMIGRIAPEKRIEQAIAILNAVRQRGHAIRLHLCGHIGDDPYSRQIADLCEANRDWIIREGRVSGQRKSEILSQCRFGIQPREAEPFGISVAEMAKAGSIVFATAQGGQTEILQHPDLLFSNHDEAVQKISVVLENKELQASLRGHLIDNSRRFTSRAFARGIQSIVSDSLNPGQQVLNLDPNQHSYA
jgi:glycosyltransferase involved in cell wall biosynthesis